MEGRRLKWIHWAIDIIKQLWEKWTDFLDMYTIEEKIQGFMHIVFFIMVASITYHLYHFDSSAERKVNPAAVAAWQGDKLPREDPIPNLHSSTITHVWKHTSWIGPDVSAVIKVQKPYGVRYKHRAFNCSGGWYHRINDEDTFEGVVGRTNGNRANAVDIRGVDYDEKQEFDYICAKYAK